jgi:YidC/Oxa1 family membrane protein insertase
MALWSVWTDMLQGVLGLLATHGGLSEAMAIITLTLLARALMLPVSLTSAVRAQRNKEALARIQPELARLKETFQGDAKALNGRVLALYRDHDIRFFDRLSLLNMATQGAFGLGLYQSLQRMSFSAKFLWIASLGKPDFWVTVLVGLLMAASMLLMPGIADNPAMLMVVLLAPLLISLLAVAALPSAVGIYWATSNAASLAQTLLLRVWMARPRKATMPA